MGMIQKQGMPYELKPRDIERRAADSKTTEKRFFAIGIVTGDEK